jgi:spermidine synthase
LYQNQFQLVTSEALYSDGDRYLPAVAATNDLNKFLPAVRNVLVLGTGLGSMVHVMRAKGYAPHYTLVEKDKIVLKWALEFLDNTGTEKIDPVCNDAKIFMEQNQKKYDFIFIDVFNGRVVPEFVTTSLFLHQCSNALTQSGHVAFNYIINNEEEWENVKRNFTEIFPGYHIISKGINRILINTPNS